MDTLLSAHATMAWEQQIHSDGLPKINAEILEYVSTIQNRQETAARGVTVWPRRGHRGASPPTAR